MRPQRAYAEHLGCIARIREYSTGGEAAAFASRTLQDAILRNYSRDGLEAAMRMILLEMDS